MHVSGSRRKRTRLFAMAAVAAAGLVALAGGLVPAEAGTRTQSCDVSPPPASAEAEESGAIPPGTPPPGVIHLSWTPPTAPCDPVTGYWVYMRDGKFGGLDPEEGWFVASFRNPDENLSGTYQVANRGHWYDFRVYAVYQGGQSQPRQAHVFVHPK